VSLYLQKFESTETLNLSKPIVKENSQRGMCNAQIY